MGSGPTDEQVSIVYLKWQELYAYEKPFQVFANVPQGSGARLTNLMFAPSPPLVIRDLRGHEDAFTLDGNGFKIVRDQMPAFDLTTKESVDSTVVPYLEDLVLKNVQGVDFVRCFDYGVSFILVRTAGSAMVRKDVLNFETGPVPQKCQDDHAQNECQ